MVWNTVYNLTGKPMIDCALRAPSLFDSYTISDPVVLGNRNLRLETSNPKELALSMRNRFDADAREPTTAAANIPNDLPLPGRSLYLELRVRH